MAAEKPRPEKVAVVDEVRERLSSADAAILTEYRGLNVNDLAALRASVRGAGGVYKIYKNTLVRLAVRDVGLDELESMLTGPTAIAFVDGDAVLVAKSLRDFSRINPNLVIKGGMLGKAVLSAGDATALADVAPRDVLLAQLAGGLAAPMRQFASLLAALPRNFAYGLKALIDQQGGAPAAAEPEVAAEPEPAAAAEPEPAEPEPAEPEPAAAPAPEPEAAAPETDAPEASENENKE